MLARKQRRLAVDACFRSRFDADTSAGFALFGRVTSRRCRFGALGALKLVAARFPRRSDFCECPFVQGLLGVDDYPARLAVFGRIACNDAFGKRRHSAESVFGEQVIGRLSAAQEFCGHVIVAPNRPEAPALCSNIGRRTRNFDDNSKQINVEKTR